MSTDELLLPGTAPGDTTTILPPNQPQPQPPSSNSPPRPQVPPGHASPVRTPHPHDVLSGRGGRINSHPGNVRFRETVDANKRTYLDPRTKKVEKARIAASIVASVRSQDPAGRFLKEDPHTGLWVEIGDERAWKKAGQALRESAPEIRAERQAQLQMLAAGGAHGVVDPMLAGSVNAGGSSVMSGTGGGSSKSRKSRQADPPGPRHRPNPPEREGLARTSSSRSNNAAELSPLPPESSSARGNTTNIALPHDEDEELARMRREYYQMQQMQKEQEIRMARYQRQLARAQGLDGSNRSSGVDGSGRSGGSGGVGGGNKLSDDGINGRYGREVYDEYNQMQQRIHQQQQNNNNNNASFNTSGMSDMARAIANDGLLPANAGFGIPSFGGEQAQAQQQQVQQQQAYQRQMMQQAYQQQQPQFHNSNGNGAVGAHEAFDRHFNSCDKTVSTMSSFDIQSMDMSSIGGGLSWNQSNMSGLISTGSVARGAGTSGGGKTALERKLERVNGSQYRGRQREMPMTMQPPSIMQGGMCMPAQGQGLAMMSPPVQQGGGEQVLNVATMGGVQQYSYQQAARGGHPSKTARGTSKHPSSREHNMSSHHMTSLNSFGFDAIEEDECSYKMSNLGLSEMDMTFSSDILSVRSKSVPKMRGGDESNDMTKGGACRRASIEEGRTRSNSTGNVDGDAPACDNNNGVAASSSAFNQSSSSNGSGSTTSKSLMKNLMKGSSHTFSMDDFNESLKSMDLEDRSRKSGGSSSTKQGRRLPDPDGAVVGGGMSRGERGGGQGQGSHHAGPGRRMDPSGGRLGTIHSSRSLHQCTAAVHNADQTRDTVSSGGARRPTNRRNSSEGSMGLSDPDLMQHAFGASAASGNNLNDFGISLGSLRSFQSVQSDGGDDDSNANNSSWLNQYNSMENVQNGRDAWDDEDAAAQREQQAGHNVVGDCNASDRGSIASEISAPRMVTAGN